MTTIDDNWIFANAAGLACQIDGWPEFAQSATPEYRSEAMLILNQSNWAPCERAARLQRLLARWQAWRDNQPLSEGL